MALYPGGSIRSPEWKAIREEIRERAGDRCEGCRVENRAIGFRDSAGTFHQTSGYSPGTVACHIPTLTMAKVFRIVCTVAHVDGDETNNDPGNLRFWCQRCHNRHDAPVRAAGRRERRG